MKHTIIAALDIGSTMIRVLIASFAADQRFEIKGIGETASKGIDNGIVKDIQALSSSIKIAFEEAENMASCSAGKIYVNITGKSIITHYGDGRISIPKTEQNKPGEILDEHITQVIGDAKNKSISILKGFDNLQILHGIPQNFSIDGQDEIINPVNMNGFQLVANVYNIFVEQNPLRNLSKAIELAGYHVEPENFVLNQIAIGKAVLSEDEKKLGCFTLDIGGGTCDIAIYNRDVLQQVYVVPMAGNDITKDLAIGLRTTITNAEYVKTMHGYADSEFINNDTNIEVDGISGRTNQPKSLKVISKVIRSRLDEILSACYQTTLPGYKPELITAGIVLTGGSANLKGIDDVVSEAFNMGVKVASPDLSEITGMISRLEDPSFATAIGLLYYAKDIEPEGRSSQFSMPRLSGSKILDKIKNFIKETV